MSAGWQVYVDGVWREGQKGDENNSTIRGEVWHNGPALGADVRPVWATCRNGCGRRFTAWSYGVNKAKHWVVEALMQEDRAASVHAVRAKEDEELAQREANR